MSSDNLDQRNESQTSENPATSYWFGKLLRQRPWMSATIILVISVGLASLLGLPRDWAWGIICWGLLIILVASGIQQERAEKADPDYVPPKSNVEGLVGSLHGYCDRSRRIDWPANHAGAEAIPRTESELRQRSEADKYAVTKDRRILESFSR